MGNKFNFTMSRLRAIQPEIKRKYYYDQIQPGLRLSVTSNGVKSFQFQVWSKKQNAPVTRTIGKFELMSIADARVEASKLLARVNKGEDREEGKNCLSLQSKSLQMNFSKNIAKKRKNLGEKMRGF